MRISKAMPRVCWGGFLLGVAVFAAAPAMGQESPSHAELLQRAMEAFWGDDPASFDMLLPLAKAGDPVAQYAVAFFFQDDRFDVPQDRPRAAALFKQSAEQGLANGQVEYARMLSVGHGGPVPRRFYSLFKSWFHKRAMYWFLKAAEQDYGGAYYALGGVYEDGRIVPQDLVQAYMWFSLTAAQGSGAGRTAQNVLSYSLTPEQIEQAERLAQQWKEELPRTPDQSTGHGSREMNAPPVVPTTGQ